MVLGEFGMSTFFESFTASGFLELSRSCECELATDESAVRIKRLFGREQFQN